MTRRRDPASIIVEIFLAATPDEATTLYRVVRGIVEARGLAVRKVASGNGTPPRSRTRKARTTTPILTSDTFPTRTSD
jgi:hypothetical protein